MGFFLINYTGWHVKAYSRMNRKKSLEASFVQWIRNIVIISVEYRILTWYQDAMFKIDIEKFLCYKLKHVSKFFTPHFVVTVRVGFKANLICQMTSFQDINDLNLYEVCLLIWQAMQNDNELKWVFVLCYWGDLYTATRTLQHSWNRIISPSQAVHLFELSLNRLYG